MKKNIYQILSKGLAKDACEKEKQEMLALFHKPEFEYLLKEELFRKILESGEADLSDDDLHKMFLRLWTTIEHNKIRSKSGKKIIMAFVRVAAAVLMGLFLGLYISHLKKAGEPEYYAAHAPRGSISEVLLPDGTIIFLNADSKIRYSADGIRDKREVFLNGEAWFDVAQDEKKPFLVHTPFYDVKVTGTQFNIKAYESDREVVTTLEEGKIVIRSGDKFNLSQDLALSPGEQAILNKESNSMVVRNVNPSWYSSWKENKLIFINMSLKELVILLERKYGVDIEVNNKDLLDLHFDGTLKNETVIEILEIIKNTLPINYKIVGQHIEITSK